MSDRRNKGRGKKASRAGNRELASRHVPFVGTLRLELERPKKKVKKKAARATAYDDDYEERGLGATFAYWATVAGLWALVAMGGVVLYYALTLPSTDSLWDIDTSPSVTITAADGTPVATRGGRHGAAVRLEDLPPYLIDAIVATEDKRFYSHLGVDPIGLARATMVNLKAGAVVQGGSTITQQLAKNIFLTPERTFHRKLQEALLALWLEAKFSKDQILTFYLNRVYLGGGAYGVESASQRYFGRSARDVTLPEAAMLAGLLKAPSRYAPTNDLARAQERAATVLAVMVRDGRIEYEDGQWAYDNPAVLRGAARSQSANYFADWVVDRVPGYAGRPNSSLIVQATLNPDLQNAAERIIAEALNRNEQALGVSQAALVAMTPDGAVRAMVGGRSYRQSQFNRAVHAERQPGSAFKPVVYMTALENGLTPDTLRVDAPVIVDGWAPRNYSETHDGVMTLTHALSKSVNTVAVQITEEVGRDNVIRTARRLGFQNDMRPHPSLALGTFEVTLLELTSAYAAFANGGASVIPHGIENISTLSGDRLYQRRGAGVGPIMSQQTLGMMNHMLSETMKTGTGRRAALGARPSGGKTGTSQDFRDAWFVGYTADLVVGVWVGNDDGAPMNEVTGGGVPARIWRDFMESTQRNIQVSALPGAYVPRQGSEGWPFNEDGDADERGFFGRLFGLSGSASGQEFEGRHREMKPGRNSWR